MDSILAFLMKIYLDSEELEEVKKHCEFVWHYASVALDRYERDEEKCKSIKEFS